MARRGSEWVGELKSWGGWAGSVSTVNVVNVVNVANVVNVVIVVIVVNPPSLTQGRAREGEERRAELKPDGLRWFGAVLDGQGG